MRGVHGRALAVLLALTLTSSAAFAAPRLPTGEGGFMKLIKLVVRVLDDVRMGFPPG